MKQWFLLIGLSLFSAAAFSQQQISNAKKTVSAQVPLETNVVQEQASDSIAFISTDKRINPVSPVEPIENKGSNTNQKPLLNSTTKKPE